MDNLNGNLGSFDISSNGNFLFAIFDSDGSVNKTGFLATIHYDILTTNTTSITTATTTTQPVGKKLQRLIGRIMKFFTSHQDMV